jgi:tetratricopeptide (TPR) repeat protein
VNLSLDGKNEEALEAFNTSISLDPELGYAYYGRAEIYKKMGMNDEALADYDTACGLEIDAACTAAESLRALIGG